MIVNQNTVILGKKVVLVPYKQEHVPTYHKWMLSEELRELTASDPLTLEEEFEMQRKWQTDADKLTFIILARMPHIGLDDEALIVNDTALGPENTAQLGPMIGDVNLFFKGTPQDEDQEVEAEVMIAESTYRHQGLAFDALQLLLHYATSAEGPLSLRVPKSRLVARIGEDNVASKRLFEKLGFVVAKSVPVFREIEMRHRGDSDWTGGNIITLRSAAQVGGV